MIDGFLRPHIQPILESAAPQFAQSGLTPNKLTLIAFALGLAGCFAIGMQAYLFGLVLILIDRGLNGVAGSIARQQGPTELGVMLDTLCDFILFGAFAFFFSMSMEGTGLAAAFLIFSYMAMGMANLSHAMATSKRGITDRPRGGIVENTEMIAFIVLCCVYPAGFAAIAAMFGIICWASAIVRTVKTVKLIKS